MSNNNFVLQGKLLFTSRSRGRSEISVIYVKCGCGCGWCISYLQLLLLEHVRSGGIEDVISELSLTIYVDWCCGFTGQEAVVDLSGTLRELEEGGGARNLDVKVKVKRQSDKTER